MIEYKERSDEVYQLGFHFKEEQIFILFLDTIEKFGNKERNYYRSFKRILFRIVRFEAGVPDNHRQNDKIKQSCLPATDAKNIKVKYKLEWNEDQTKPYMICEINIHDNDTLREWNNTRY
jgi:hypothetical protein